MMATFPVTGAWAGGEPAVGAAGRRPVCAPLRRLLWQLGVPGLRALPGNGAGEMMSPRRCRCCYAALINPD